MYVISTLLEHGCTTLEIADGPPADFSTLHIRIGVPRTASLEDLVARAQSAALERARDLIGKCLHHNLRIVEQAG